MEAGIEMESVRIIASCVAAAVLYGIVHDEFTAHICVEYFTVAHPHIFPTDSPTLLGIAWGIAGTWWLGLFLGIILACCSRAGSAEPKIDARFIARRIVVVLAVMAFSAVLAGSIAYCVVLNNHLPLPDPMVPQNKHVAFYSVWAAHLASYIVAISGGLIVILDVLRRRLSAKI